MVTVFSLQPCTLIFSLTHMYVDTNAQNKLNIKKRGWEVSNERPKVGNSSGEEGGDSEM